MPCAFSSIVTLRRRVCFVVVVLLTVRCLSGRDDALAVIPLHETHCQKHVTDEACDQFPVLAWLIEIEPIDRTCRGGFQTRPGAANTDREVTPLSRERRLPREGGFETRPYKCPICALPREKRVCTTQWMAGTPGCETGRKRRSATGMSTATKIAKTHNTSMKERSVAWL